MRWFVKGCEIFRNFQKVGNKGLQVIIRSTLKPSCNKYIRVVYVGFFEVVCEGLVGCKIFQSGFFSGDLRKISSKTFCLINCAIFKRLCDKRMCEYAFRVFHFH